jgi:hypothetical protein
LSDDLVQTPNGTFVTREDAEAAGLEVPKRKAAPRKTHTTKATTRRKSTSRRKAAGAAATRKGK